MTITILTEMDVILHVQWRHTGHEHLAALLLLVLDLIFEGMEEVWIQSQATEMMETPVMVMDVVQPVLWKQDGLELSVTLQQQVFVLMIEEMEK